MCVFPPATVTFSLSNVTVATTSWFVNSVSLYVIVANGNDLSIQVTFAVAVPSFPALSINLNINSPFSVNVCVFPPSLVVVTSTSLFPLVSIIYGLSVAVTFVFVSFVIL